jgi:hypothetical protein
LTGVKAPRLGEAGAALLFIVGDRGRRGFRVGGTSGSFLGGAACFLFRANPGFFLGAAIFLGASALFFGGDHGLLVVAAARFLERVHPRFFGFAEQALLKLAARGGIVGGTLRRTRSGRRLGSLRNRLRRWRGFLHLGHFGFARPSKDAALLHLDHDGVRPAMTEALLHLAGLNRALQAQRRARSEFRLI